MTRMKGMDRITGITAVTKIIRMNGMSGRGFWES